MADYLVQITEDDIIHAETYMPLTIKEKVTRSMATLLMEPVEVKTGDGDSLPLMARENRKLRAQFTMGVLATKLHKEYAQQNVRVRAADGETVEQPLAWVMDEESYEQWAASHVMNQLERLKKSKNGEVVNHLFDLLYDCKVIDIMLSGAIRDELDAHNDIFNRAMEWLSVSAADAAVKEMVSGELREVLNSAKGDAQ